MINDLQAIIKIGGFGTFKIDVGRNPKIKKSNDIYDTIRYTIPKALNTKDISIKICSFEVDIYSFVMTYCKIISKRKSFGDIYKNNEIFVKIMKEERSNFPSNFNELCELIK